MKKSTSWRLVPYYLLVVLVPLVHAPFLNSAIFTAPKLLVLRLVTACIVLGWSWRFCCEGKLVLRRGIFGWVLLGMAVVAMVTTVFSSFFWTSVLGVEGRFMGVFTVLNLLGLAWLAFNDIRDSKEMGRILRVSVSVAGIVGFYAVLQHMVWFDDLTKDFFRWAFSPTERAFGTFGHSTHLAAYLAMHVPVALWVLSEIAEAGRRKLIWVGVLVILFGGILASGSRGGFVAGLLVSVGMGFYLWKNSKKKVKKILVGLLGGVLVLVIGLGAFGGLKISERIGGFWQQISAGETVDRQSWWLSSIDMWKERPVIGNGLSTFADKYNGVRRLDYRVPADEQDRIVPQNAHMEFLNVLATQGIVGLLAYLLMLGYLGWSALSFLRSEKQVMVAGLGFCLVAYLIHSLLSFGVVSTLVVFYLFAGGMMAVISGKKNIVNVRMNVRCWGGLICGVLIILTGIGIYFSGKMYLADVVYLKAKTAELYDQEDLYLSAIKLNPNEYEYYVEFGDDLLRKARISNDVAFSNQKLNQALNAYNTALKINNVHPNVYNHKAEAFEMLSEIARGNGDMQLEEDYFEAAVANHEMAIEMGPFNPLYAYDLAQLYYGAGNYEEAIQYYEMVLEWRDEYEATYQNLAVSYEEVGDLVRALEYGEKAMELYPEVIEFQEYVEKLQNLISESK